ncbi:hypothetical protein ACIBF5_09100 [Micromonospora sp. NPDC050417]|uniref:hypothetical protein n=1 Tax=Micromonospora sp. NPDC050417 TaxID=3364280 RepID=UPI0037B7FBAF
MAQTIAFVMAGPRDAEVERLSRDARTASDARTRSDTRTTGDARTTSDARTRSDTRTMSGNGGTTEIMNRIIAKGMGN